MAITNGYATLAEAKAYLNIVDSIDDTMLESMVEAASRAIDNIAGRRFYLDTSASARLYRGTNPYILTVDDFGSTTGLALALDTGGDGTYETVLTYNTDYVVEPFNAIAMGKPYTQITLVGGQLLPWLLPNLRPSVQLTAKWGYPTVPDDISQACLILTADMYKRKDSVGGNLGISELGAIRMSPLGRDIAAMTRAYRREVIA
ncbi:gp6 domain containing protein [uncultured Caudovirales phage]|uniref:Gp6 domain containing protein n=1 Tax=uncultured Caudovirales phage TaxID=2100421 RepID=A0A6J5T0V0_9CAUD|nr:gp6 domain containing protein [uncultured Caudovirales phage]CAB4186113.1 gp6 domain containing protein [uncultured Caudovirales phage]CAB4194211.1 gp6 domain containing protein [uncultured Caudovirales phage]CAB4220277.1 gp6 domain containing protein [uncultured Caudovirales phage]CAB5231023.1 gp6 domain containing protein [uncultured Caudovirales phage]